MGDQQMFMGDQNNSAEQLWHQGGKALVTVDITINIGVFVQMEEETEVKHIHSPQSGDDSSNLTPKV